jgi:hypothetical protein
MARRKNRLPLRHPCLGDYRLKSSSSAKGNPRFDTDLAVMPRLTIRDRPHRCLRHRRGCMAVATHMTMNVVSHHAIQSGASNRVQLCESGIR